MTWLVASLILGHRSGKAHVIYVNKDLRIVGRDHKMGFTSVGPDWHFIYKIATIPKRAARRVKSSLDRHHIECHYFHSVNDHNVDVEIIASTDVGNESRWILKDAKSQGYVHSVQWEYLFPASDSKAPAPGSCLNLKSTA